MALHIMKLAIEATSSVTINPVVQRFFHTTVDLLQGPTTLDIDAARFFDDTGAAVSSLPELKEDSYFKTFINGVLQMDDLLSYTPGTTGIGKLSINIPNGSTILLGSPVVLEIVNFSPDARTTVHR